MPDRIVAARILRDARNDGSLREREFFHVLAEVLSGCGLDAICSGSQIDRVKIVFQNTVLGSLF